MTKLQDNYLSDNDGDGVVWNPPAETHVGVFGPRRQMSESYCQLHAWLNGRPEECVLFCYARTNTLQ